MDPFTQQWLQYGILGLIILGIMLGWIELKPAIDERKRERAEDKVTIQGLTDALRNVTDVVESRRR